MEKNNFLRTLWQEHMAEECMRMEEEEQELVKDVVAVEENLRQDFSKTEQQLLEIYHDRVADLHAVSLARAFEKGVIFATQYMRAVFGE